MKIILRLIFIQNIPIPLNCNIQQLRRNRILSSSELLQKRKKNISVHNYLSLFGKRNIGKRIDQFDQILAVCRKVDIVVLDHLHQKCTCVYEQLRLFKILYAIPCKLLDFELLKHFIPFSLLLILIAHLQHE